MTDAAKQDSAGAWLFVDDNLEAAGAFVQRLGEGENGIHVKALPPSEGRRALLTDAKPVGVLMDVDLTGEQGEHGTGLGLAQDIRARQKAGKLPEYPIIRFANPEPVLANVGGDPASDDLFDDMMDKREVGRDADAVRRRMAGVVAVYDALAGARADALDFSQLLALGERELADWVHPSLIARLADGRSQAVHVAAGTYLRTFLLSPGALIDRSLLTLRLGLTAASADAHWPLIEAFAAPFTFRGAGSAHHPRWWARGLEESWEGLHGSMMPLAITAAVDRAATLSEALGVHFEPLVPSEASPGERPWRWCSISLEADPPRLEPVDPRFGVRMTSRTDRAPWTEPLMASIGAAIRNREDRRLDTTDIVRLREELR